MLLSLCHCHCVTVTVSLHCVTVTVSLYRVLFVLYDDPPCLLAGGHHMSHGAVHCYSVPPSLDHLGRHLTALSPHQVAPVGAHQLTVTLCPPFSTGTLHPHSSYLHSLTAARSLNDLLSFPLKFVWSCVPVLEPLWLLRAHQVWYGWCMPTSGTHPSIKYVYTHHLGIIACVHPTCYHGVTCS